MGISRLEDLFRRKPSAWKTRVIDFDCSFNCSLTGEFTGYPQEIQLETQLEIQLAIQLEIQQMHLIFDYKLDTDSKSLHSKRIKPALYLLNEVTRLSSSLLANKW